LIWRYCKMFFTESAARGLIDVIDVIDHGAWRPIDKEFDPAAMHDSCWAAPARPSRPSIAAADGRSADAGAAAAARRGGGAVAGLGGRLLPDTP
jgi:hypothetical protein